MATMKIECEDSIGFVQYGRECTESGRLLNFVSLTSDRATVKINGVPVEVAYHKNSSEVATFSNGMKASCFLFQNVDLSFLSTSNVKSAKLVVIPQDTIENINLTFQTLTVRPEIRAAYYAYYNAIHEMSVGPAHVMQVEVYENSNRFFTVNETTQLEPIEIDLTGSIDTIQNLCKYGLKINVNSTKLVFIYGILASQNLRPYIEIEYLSDNTPPTVSPLSPVSDVVNGDKPITFTWSYSQDVNEPQSHYSIQQQTSSGWQDLIPKTAGTAHTATAPAGTFTAGQAAWRVMVWSQNGTVASQWSDPAYIIVQSQPKAPNITSAGTSPSPTFAWQAAQQQGYEIILGDYQAGVKYGTEKTWTYPGTLQNGNVIFQIRVQNAQGIWSPWAGVETYISNVPKGTVSLSGSVKDQAVSLSWTSSGLTASQYNVLRDGKVIATTQNTAFTDYYSAGKCAYQVYAMLSGGYYTPSNVLTEIVKPKYAMISLASSISWIPLRIKSGGLPTYGSEMQTQAAFVHYQGRELPVAYTTGFLDKSYTYSFSFLRKEDMQAFAKLCGQMVILKTPQGERSIGILTGISATRQNRINDFSFSITEIDFSEVELNA